VKKTYPKCQLTFISDEWGNVVFDLPYINFTYGFQQQLFHFLQSTACILPAKRSGRLYTLMAYGIGRNWYLVSVEKLPGKAA
jgi:hypothetical protein